MKRDIENAFHERMLALYHVVGHSAEGYWPHRFLRAVKNHGGLAAAKKFINDAVVSDGFDRLETIGLLDFTVEALILKKPWSQLFTAAEQDIARSRLQEHGYDVTELGMDHAADWTVLKHFVVYHAPDKRGFSIHDNPPKSIVTNRPVKNTIGNRVWLVTGEGKPRRYFLASTFVVDHIGTDGPAGFPNSASGEIGQTFRPPLAMDDEPWFPAFLKFNGNFAFGLNEFTSRPEFIEGLWRLINRNHEERIVNQIKQNPKIDQTTKQALIDARRGQGLFKKRLMMIERCCRVTKVCNPDHLIASHSKPWKDSTDEERLDGNNGLLLSPNIDHLFNMGLISFTAGGDLLVSPQADKVSLRRLGVRTDKVVNVGSFTTMQQQYLAYHRQQVFKQARA